MDYGITDATLFWLFVPMPLIIILAVITYFAEKERVKQNDY